MPDRPGICYKRYYLITKLGITRNKDMKLSDWAKKQGIAYLTAYRWFKDGKLPVEAYQSESGTIIVKDEEVPEQSMANHSNGDQSSDVMSVFIKKTVEFSKNNATIEEFAAYILSNFSLKFSFGQETPKYSKNKPKPEDIQKHFQQFMKKGEKPKANVFIEAAANETIDDLVAKADSLTAQELVNQIQHLSEQDGESPTPSVPELNDLLKVLAPNASQNVAAPKVYGDLGTTEGLVSRTVDFDSTPQQINYTSSTDQTFSESFPITTTFTASNIGVGDWFGATTNAYATTTDTGSFLANGTATQGGILSLNANTTTTVVPNAVFSSAMFPAASTFKPTQKELETASKLATTDITPRKRGRKPSKNK